MATKKKTKTDEKFEKQDLNLFEALAALDKKDYDYYDKLTEEQKKKFVPYMMTLWMSSIKGNANLQGYYVRNTEYTANKHLFDEHVQKHPKLQWLMATTVSPGLGTFRHQWIAPKKKEAGGNGSIQKQLSEIFPNKKQAPKLILAESLLGFIINALSKRTFAFTAIQLSIAGGASGVVRLSINCWAAKVRLFSEFSNKAAV